ncbi:IDEAL domain-containing protein [Paenibacillus sp. FSL L8-0470]|uniref:IDEAL domain-containing protein n=1 Tax=Paenibacillus sp. FSL L8-0470 TaxID=2954688 RepID=UPI0030FB00F4
MQTGLNNLTREHYETLLSIHAEVVLEAAIEKRLRRLIDQALDQGDEAAFRLYAAEMAGKRKDEEHE